MSKKVHLLDYVAGNIRSLVNAIERCGYEVEWIKSPDDVKNAEVNKKACIFCLALVFDMSFAMIDTNFNVLFNCTLPMFLHVACKSSVSVFLQSVIELLVFTIPDHVPMDFSLDDKRHILLSYRFHSFH